MNDSIKILNFTTQLLGFDIFVGLFFKKYGTLNNMIYNFYFCNISNNQLIYSYLWVKFNVLVMLFSFRVKIDSFGICCQSHGQFQKSTKEG
jgi:hypothetical protein